MRKGCPVLPKKKLELMNVKNILDTMQSHIEENKENLSAEVKESLLRGHNSIESLRTTIEELNNIGEQLYKKKDNGKYDKLNDITLNYLSQQYTTISMHFTNFRKKYMENSNSKELMSWLSIFDVRLKDDMNVIKRIHPNSEISLPDAVEKYTDLPDGYSYKDHMNSISRSVKRSEQISKLGKLEGKDNSALKQLSAKINTLKQNKTLLSEDETNELINLYASAGVELKEATDRNKGNNDLYSFFQNMMKKFSKDYTALHKYKNKISKQANPTLLNIDDFFEKSRTRTIKLPDVDLSELSTSGAGQNIRYKVNFKIEDEPVKGASKGDIVTGYFTENKNNNIDHVKKSKVTSDAEFNNRYIISDEENQAIIDYIASKYPNEREFIEGPLKNDSDIYLLAKFVDTHKTLRSNSGKYGTKISMSETVDSFKTIYMIVADETKGDEVLEKIRKDETKFQAYIEYASLYHKQSFVNDINRGNSINMKAAQGKRNALCSSIAEVLGCPDIVAFSEKVKLETTENGKKAIKTGVLMMPARGKDINASRSNSDFNKLTKLSFENNPELINQYAALQFLDFITGNTDRHNGNYFFDFDENGKLCVIQGIDNDTSFGARADLYNVGEMVKWENLRIIPKSMADAVKKMKPEAFEILLHGYDLDKDEIKNTVNRFKQIKENIIKSEEAYKNTEPGFLDLKIPRIVPDNEVKHYFTCEQLQYVSPNKKNLFGLALLTTGRNSMPIEALKNDENHICDLSQKITQSRLDRGQNSLYQNLKDFKKTAAYDKHNVGIEGTFETMISNTEKLFGSSFSKKCLLDNKGPVSNNANLNKCDLYVTNKNYTKYKNTLIEAVSATNAYLDNASDTIIDYQTCKAEIDMYKKAGNSEEMNASIRNLRELEKNPEVKKYKLAVKIRNKLTEQLDSLDTISELCSDMALGKQKYEAAVQAKKNNKHAKSDNFGDVYITSGFMKKAHDTVVERNKRNKINKPEAQKKDVIKSGPA